MTVIETLIYCSITYWLTALNPGGEQFIYFVIFCGVYYFVSLPALFQIVIELALPSPGANVTVWYFDGR